MSPRVRPHRMPTTTAKLGVDTVRMLRAVIGTFEHWKDRDALHRREPTLDDAIWRLARAAGMTSGRDALALRAIELDRSVYLSPPAEKGIPNRSAEGTRGR